MLPFAFAQIPIHDIQFTTDPNGDSPLNGQQVTTGGIVTGVNPSGSLIRYYIADRAGGLWSGILVNDNANRLLAIGDSVSLTAEVQESSGQTRLRNVIGTFVTVPGAGAVPVYNAGTGGINEATEGVLVEFTNPVVISVNSSDTTFVVSDGSGNATIGRSWHFAYYPQVGDTMRFLRGIVSFTNNTFYVNPRSDQDLAFFSNRPPVFVSISTSPTNPSQLDHVTVLARLLDEGFVAEAQVFYRFHSTDAFDSTALVDDGNHGDGAAGDGTWGAVLPPGPALGTCDYYLKATDNEGETAWSPNGAPAQTYHYNIRLLTQIADIYNNYDVYADSTVTLRGVVTHVQDVTTSSGSRRISAYIQDESGRGFSLSQSGAASLFPDIVRGNLIEITGYVNQFGGTIQLGGFSDASSEVIQLGDAQFPEPIRIQTGNYRLQRDIVRTSHTDFYGAGTWVRIVGTIFRVDENVGGGTNIQVDDGSGNIILRVWDAMNLDSVQLNDRWYRMSELVGVTCSIDGVSSTFNGDFQMLGGYAEDFTTGQPDVLPSEPLVLNVANRPFAPDLGQKISIFVNGPAAAERRVRVYDLRGRLVTTLLNSLSGGPAALEWDGRDELNQIVPIGTYILHFESVLSGKTESITRPLVVGTKL